jgi:hypothetical protein
MRVRSILPLLCLALSLEARAASISFEFDELPSTAGASYSGSVAEASAYAVSSGLLLQDTTPFGSDHAFYQVAAIYEPLFAATLEWRARRIEGSDLATEIAVFSPMKSVDLFLSNDGVRLHTGGADFPLILAMDTGVFHTYRLEIAAADSSFSLYVDDVLSYSGTAIGSGQDRLVWGDSTSSGGNAQAEWDYIRFTNAVPEPSGFLLVAPVLAGLGLKALRRRLKDAPRN